MHNKNWKIMEEKKPKGKSQWNNVKEKLEVKKRKTMKYKCKQQKKKTRKTQWSNTYVVKIKSNWRKAEVRQCIIKIDIPTDQWSNV